MQCPNCGKEIIQTDGKRKKQFCNSTCRSNVWHKERRKNKKPTPKKPETTKEPLDKDAEIAKIEELLKMPEKYVDALKRAKLENRLYELRYSQQ